MKKIWGLVWLFIWGFSNAHAQISAANLCNEFVEKHLNDASVSIMATHPLENIIALNVSQGLALYRTPTFELIDLLLMSGDSDSFVGVMAWSPNGDRIAAASYYADPPNDFGDIMGRVRLDIWDIETKAILYSITDIPLEPIGLGSLVWSPDGKYLASRVRRSGSVQVWDATTGQLVFEYEVSSKSAPDDDYDLLDWSADSTSLLIGNAGDPRYQKVTRVALDADGEWTVAAEMDATLGELHGLSLSVNNELALLLGGTLQFWQPETLELRSQLFDRDYLNTTLDWSADGSLLALGGRYYDNYGIAIYNLAEDSFQTFNGQSILVSEIQWSADQRYIYTLGNTGDAITGYYYYEIYVWDIENHCLRAIVTS